MKTLRASARTYDHPVRIVQFGEGNFLRAFWDKAIHELNVDGVFKGQIAVVQPIERGKVADLARQDYLYTVCLQSQGEESITKVESIKTGIDPYTQFDRFLELAKSPDLRFVFSNTTEAGIVFDEEDYLMPVRHDPTRRSCCSSC
jgi:tagaturonate reductase